MTAQSRLRAAVIGALLPLLATLVVDPAAACSTFRLERGDTLLFGKNYDWNVDAGLVIVNKRGVAKTSLPTGTGEQLSWVSRYGSVTFNQYGREMPMGGMNEAGLVIELMWLDETEYPAPDQRPAVGNLQWIQYQLDLHRSADQVIASDADVRITRGGAARVHYLVADADGHVAAIDFLDGAMKAYTGDDLPVTALTNSSYASSCATADAMRRDGGASWPPRGAGSHARFARLMHATGSAGAAGTTPVDEAFGILEDVSQGSMTKWSIVYDQTARTVTYRSRRASERKRLAFADLDFDCASPVRVFDVNANAAGDIAPLLIDYTTELNRGLIQESFEQTSFLAGAPEAAIDGLAHYPEELVCEGADGGR
jgi:choloylglycine hydrolase